MAENNLAVFERNLFQFLQDPSKQAKILQGLGHPEFLHPSSHLTPSGTAKGVKHPTPSGMDKDVEHPIPSGTSGGGFGYPSGWYPLHLFLFPIPSRGRYRRDLHHPPLKTAQQMGRANQRPTTERKRLKQRVQRPLTQMIQSSYWMTRRRSNLIPCLTQQSKTKLRGSRHNQ